MCRRTLSQHITLVLMSGYFNYLNPTLGDCILDPEKTALHMLLFTQTFPLSKRTSCTPIRGKLPRKIILVPNTHPERNTQVLSDRLNEETGSGPLSQWHKTHLSTAEAYSALERTRGLRDMMAEFTDDTRR